MYIPEPAKLPLVSDVVPLLPHTKVRHFMCITERENRYTDNVRRIDDALNTGLSRLLNFFRGQDAALHHPATSPRAGFHRALRYRNPDSGTSE